MARSDSHGKVFSGPGGRARGAVLLLLLAWPSAALAGETPSRIASWQPPSIEQVRAQVFAWLDQRKLGPGERAKAEAIWAQKAEAASGADVLERVIRTVALADEDAGKLAALCSQAAAPRTLPPQPWLANPQTPAWVAKNFRLWYGRWLAQQRLFDEAAEQLDGIQAEEVVDPASLLFYQAIVHHRLLNRDAAADGAPFTVCGVLERGSAAGLLESVQRDMHAAARARLESRTVTAESFDQVREILEPVTAEKGGGKFVMAHLKDAPEVDAQIKALKASVRCIPFEDRYGGAGKCILTGETVPRRVVVAKAY